MVQDEQRPHAQKQRERQECDELDRAFVEHDRVVGTEQRLGEVVELAEHELAQRAFGAHGLDRLDPLDRVYLTRLVLTE